MQEQVSRISTKPPPNKARLECFGRVLDAVVGLLKLPLPAATAAERDRRAKVEGVIARCLSYDAPQLHEMLFRALEV